MFNWKEKLVFKGDKILWYVIIGLMIASVMVVYSSTGKLAYKVHGGNTAYFLIKQLLLIGGCFFVMLTLQSIHYKYFLAFSSIILGMSFVFLVWAEYFGVNLNDAGRWLRIPIIGFTFQPSEMAKLGVIMYTARMLSFYQGDYECDKQVLREMIWVLPVLGVIFMNNFSTSVLLGGVCFVMLFIGRVDLNVLGKLMGVLVIAAILFVTILLLVPKSSLERLWRLPTIRDRIESFLGIGEVSRDDTYQADEAKIAVAKGGLLGVGPGNSVQRNFLPHPYSDFIFAIIIEEYGLSGGMVIMVLYLILLYRVGVIVRRCTRTFPAILVAGLMLCVLFQALINMGVCVGLFPVTGQPLPLVSMGGTSLLFTSAAFGMVLSVSHTFSPEGEREARKKEREKQRMMQQEETSMMHELEKDEFGGYLENEKMEEHEESYY